MSLRRKLLLGLVLLSASLMTVPAGAVEVYFIRFASPGWDLSVPLDINADGSLVGIYRQGGNTRGFLYSGGSVVEIRPPGWGESIARGINDSGAIAGYGDEGGVMKAFLYSGGSYTTLLPPGATESSAGGINNDGEVFGYATFGGTQTGYLYSGGTYSYYLPPGFTAARVTDAGTDGRIVGEGTLAGSTQAFLYSDGVFSNPAPSGWSTSRALKVTAGGDILGTIENIGDRRCFLLSGGTHRIIIPPDWRNATCEDINDRGEIVGEGSDETGNFSPFVYRKGRYHTMHEWRGSDLFQPTAINNKRELVGVMAFDFMTGEAFKGYLLPEPDLKADGEDGTVVARAASPPVLKAAVAGFTFTGRRVDWWLLAQTPAGPFTFDAVSRSWRPGFFPTLSGPLRDVPSVPLPPVGTAPGVYTYHLGIDLQGNGAMDVKFLILDSISVFLR